MPCKKAKEEKKKKTGKPGSYYSASHDDGTYWSPEIWMLVATVLQTSG